jgi:hypothetical protein
MKHVIETILGPHFGKIKNRRRPKIPCKFSKNAACDEQAEKIRKNVKHSRIWITKRDL